MKVSSAKDGSGNDCDILLMKSLMLIAKLGDKAPERSGKFLVAYNGAPVCRRERN